VDAEAVGGEAIRERHAVQGVRDVDRFVQMPLDVIVCGTEPAVACPFDGIEEALAAEGPETILLAAIGHLQTKHRAFEQGRVAT
jgi:hypothetical protein